MYYRVGFAIGVLRLQKLRAGYVYIST